MLARVFTVALISLVCACSTHSPLKHASYGYSAIPLESYDSRSLGTITHDGKFSTDISDLESQYYIIGIEESTSTLFPFSGDQTASIVFYMYDDRGKVIINSKELIISLNAINSSDKRRTLLWVSGYCRYVAIDMPMAKTSGGATRVDLDAGIREPSYYYSKGWGSSFKGKKGERYHLVVELEGVNYQSTDTLPSIVVIKAKPQYIDINAPVT
jgi:hypothetical protein